MPAVEGVEGGEEFVGAGEAEEDGVDGVGGEEGLQPERVFEGALATVVLVGLAVGGSSAVR